MKEENKDLNYWKENAKDAYMTTPICVLRYITELENAVENNVVNDSNLYTADQVKALIQECCGEVYCEDGILKGKSRAELYKWIENKKL